MGVVFTLDPRYPREFENGYPNKIAHLRKWIKLAQIAMWYSVNGFIRIHYFVAIVILLLRDDLVLGVLCIILVT